MGKDTRQPTVAGPAQRHSLSVQTGGGGFVRTVNVTEIRDNLAAALDSVINDAEELVVTRSQHAPWSSCRSRSTSQ